MNQERENQEPKPVIGAEMVASVSIENLVNRRNATAEKISALFAQIRECVTETKSANIGMPIFAVALTNTYGYAEFNAQMTDVNFEELFKKAVRRVDTGAWSYLMHESGLRTFMDSKARKEWDEKIHACDVPELTTENIRATFSNIHASRLGLLERGVIEVFRQLSWNYKTNQPFKFGKKIIVSNLFCGYGHGASRWMTSSVYKTTQLDDLDRVLRVLDGKPELDHRQSWSAQLAGRRAGRGSISSDYFNVTWFLNGNGHIVFKRDDLVQKLNVILTKHYPDALACEV